jgi:hypothetical protein
MNGIPAMRQLVLHIGAHKTASTAIQGWFNRNRQVLQKNGVIYPRTNWHHRAQHRLAFAMKNPARKGLEQRADLGRETEELNAAIAAAPSGARILVSSEEFFSAPRDRIVALRDSVCCDNVKILAFVRRPDDLFLSIYNQRAKEPRNNFTRPITAFLRHPYSLSRDLDMRRCICNWADVFGQDSVDLNLYEECPPLPKVLDMLGVDYLTPPEVKRVNKSAPASVVELMRLSKRAGMSVQARRELFVLAQETFGGDSKLVLTADERRNLLRACEQDLEALFDRFGRPNPYRAELIEAGPEHRESFRPLPVLMKLMDQLLCERTERRNQSHEAARADTRSLLGWFRRPK